jgi:hypothetical protein
MLKPTKKGDTGPIPELKGNITPPKPQQDLKCERVGEHFIVNVNGFMTILDKDQAVYIGSRLMAGVTELAQETPPPVERWRDEER